MPRDARHCGAHTDVARSVTAASRVSNAAYSVGGCGQPLLRRGGGCRCQLFSTRGRDPPPVRPQSEIFALDFALKVMTKTPLFARAGPTAHKLLSIARDMRSILFAAAAAGLALLARAESTSASTPALRNAISPQ